jgi:hypothetical protein
VCYAIVSLFVPLSRETRQAYNLSLTQAHIISFIAVLPLFVVWYVAFYCYGVLQKYAHTVRKGPEGEAFQKIADGVMVLSWGLIVQAFASLILGNVADQTDSFRSVTIILQNYITLAFPVVAFTLIASGTRKLLPAKHGYNTLPSSRLLIVTFAVVAAVYSYLIVHLHHKSGYDPYHLNSFWLLATIIVPYLYAWLSGLVAAFDVSLHARVTHGLLYKRSLKLLSAGMIILIAASILLQYMNSLFLSDSAGTSINAVLLVDYILLFGMAIGYVMMISGVRGLQKIEEI